MSANRRFKRTPVPGQVLICALLAQLVGCTNAPRVATVADRYHLDLALEPDRHRLSARAQIDLVRVDSEPTEPGTAVVAFQLHPELNVRRVQVPGTRVMRHWIDRAAQQGDQTAQADKTKPLTHFVQLDHAPNAFTLTVDYEGSVFQDVQSGERAGQIHNFDMSAHVGTDGIYLADGAWYPEPVAGDDTPPRATDFSLTVAPVPNMTLAVSAERAPAPAAADGTTTWRSPYPIDRLVIAGGPHEVHAMNHRGVRINAHLKPKQAQHADGLLASAGNILDKYEPLIGPYPAREYKIVDNFFSSGFAFPTMTLLSSAVIEMGSRSQTTHGYLDHEMLHSWWGNGVLVDLRYGNWCESLTSYATNYYGYVLDGDFDEARRKRRNYAHFLTRLEPDKDLPLDTFGRPGGCGRGIAYQKGAAVFHMLAREMQQEQFWSAMRRFNERFTGRHASWADIKNICEETIGSDLSGFFDQWVHGAGAPRLTLESADYDSTRQELRVTIKQEGSPFSLRLPLRVGYSSRTQDHVVLIDSERSEIVLPMDETPITVELDPDYHVFRRVPTEQIIPTTASTRTGEAFTSVVADDQVPDAYTRIRDIFGSSFEEDQRLTRSVSELREGDLANRCVLILGDAVRAPYVSGFLEAIEFPVRWTNDGFEISGVRYDDPSDALLCTVRHPGVAGGGVTVVYANSEDSIPSPFAVPMYEHSLVVFEQGRPSVRLDFEKHDIQAVVEH